MRLGVIVARFQVPDLHAGHMVLMSHAMQNNDQVAVFLGTGDARGTVESPLDFQTRRMMVNAHYPEATVLSLRDRSTDLQWSRDLDTAIGALCKSEEDEVTLYCSRDGFKPHYKGRFNVEEVVAVPEYSGQSLRAQIGGRPLESRDFRRGVIYASTQKYATTYPTVDIAVVKDGAVLMGRRPGQARYQFPGGFVGFTDTSMEETCKRELFEETEIEIADVNDLEYVCTSHIKDSRYAGSDARIMTTLFMVDYSKTAGTQNADYEEFEDLAWVTLPSPELVEEYHHPLLFALHRHLTKELPA